MDLFAAAGVDDGGGKARGGKSAAPRLRVPLFNHRVVDSAAKLAAFAPTDEQIGIAAAYAKKAAHKNFALQGEQAVRSHFITEIFGKLLGYRPLDPAGLYQIVENKAIRGGFADVALGRFSGDNSINEIVAPFELKRPAITDLDAVPAKSGRSPVQQAWDYANDAPGSRWVLVSNCVEIRLYRLGRGRDVYEWFDLRQLANLEEHRRLWLFLSAERFLGDEIDRLLRDSESAYRKITDELYEDYKKLRKNLIGWLAGDAGLTELAAIGQAQKILDRVLFVAFAQGTDLLRGGLLKETEESGNPFAPVPLWSNFQGLFRYLDIGHFDMDITAFNGGLFAPDPVLDRLIVPDWLTKDLARLGEWDYRGDVPVTVLGHIFEQSITDIEAMRASALGQAPPAETKRKREGVVYTPDIVTRFLVQRTIGVTLQERFSALLGIYATSDALSVNGDAIPWRDGDNSARAFWRDYARALRDLTILDPACGSGAFLVAAFDELLREYRRVVSALEALGEKANFDPYDDILARNLHGVDLNEESVEITRLALWLKTARRKHRLQNLEATIKAGNSLIADDKWSDHAFEWEKKFPDIFSNGKGGFDIVIGNPPYVRMELIKPVKPYLEKHYAVAADRADLYAYFFEKGVELLKAGGRLGYISSSTFFRTGSGENLRAFLAAKAAIESVVDFGDLQIFEGVTTYPAIITLKKETPAAEGEYQGPLRPAHPRVMRGLVPRTHVFDAAKEKDVGGRDEPGHDGQSLRPMAELSFLKMTDAMPADLGAAFAAGAKPMPRARLTAGAWRFEEENLARLRDKIAKGRKTLGEVYGAPAAGIKTGFNHAFVIGTEERNALIKIDPRSVEIIRPLAMGDSASKWTIIDRGSWIIYTPRDSIDIDKYPAIRGHLLRFKSSLEARALDQHWFELQQAQQRYVEYYSAPKIVFRDISHEPTFSFESDELFLDMTCFCLPTNDHALLALLNSRIAWFFWKGFTPELRGGYVRLKTQFVTQLPIPELGKTVRRSLEKLAERCTSAARERFSIQSAFRKLLFDLAAPGLSPKFSRKLENWHELDWASFLVETKRVFKTDIPLRNRAEWQTHLAENSATVNRLTAEIAAAEREIDAIVYRLFDLTPDEIALLEVSLAGQA